MNCALVNYYSSTFIFMQISHTSLKIYVYLSLFMYERTLTTTTILFAQHNVQNGHYLYSADEKCVLRSRTIFLMKIKNKKMFEIREPRAISIPTNLHIG